MSVLLVCKGVSKRFGGVIALNNVTFEVKKGEVLGIIGPNGAGKSTLFDCICGLTPLDSGTIEFNGKNITGLSPQKICKMGIGRTFQIMKPFLNLTVLENVMIGVLYGGGVNDIGKAKEKALELIEFVGLTRKKHTLCSELTGQDLKILELARALAINPKLLLLDEVCGGLTPSESEKICTLIRSINEKGVTIMWVEHVMRAIMRYADEIIVLHQGKLLSQGKPKEIASDEKVIEAYLGTKAMEV